MLGVCLMHNGNILNIYVFLKYRIVQNYDIVLFEI